MFIGIERNIIYDLEKPGALGILNQILWNTALESTALEVGRSRVRFPMVSLEFFIDIILPAALWSRG